jgi:hypothetical protein
MNLQSLKPAADFARMYGCKAIVFGPPGSRKTPLINTCPRPLMLACEPGMLSMRGSTVPTFQAFTGKAVDEFFSWFFGSNERKNFDTLAIDSTSQMADIYLQEALNGSSQSGNKKHGLAAYGDMATKVMTHLRPLFFTEQIHTYLIAKEGTKDGMKWPYYPGQQLLTDVPHMYDFILHLGLQNIPGVGQTLAFRCNQSLDVLARNRTGNLNDFEKPHFGELITKAMNNG